VEQQFHDMAPSTGAQSIDRAAQLLVQVVQNPLPTSVGELAETTGLPKSTTSRLVRALERQGLVQRDGTRGALRPGPVLLRFARRGGADVELIARAGPALRRLAEQTGETINLAVAGADGVEHLAQEDSRHFIGGTNWVGRTVPFHCSANGKVLLAFGVAPSDEAPPETELAAIRRRGYATAVEELEPGLAAVAAPVRGAAGEVVAALSISAPTIRITPGRLDELGRLLVRESTALDHDPKRGAA
jgi:DNA-binding IclR family transcriptional regulator